MEIDNTIIEIMRTCLMEEWGKEDVTDEQVQSAIENALLTSVHQDFKLFQLPRTKEALNNYYKEQGFPEKAISEQGENDGD